MREGGRDGRERDREMREREKVRERERERNDTFFTNKGNE